MIRLNNFQWYGSASRLRYEDIYEYTFGYFKLVPQRANLASDVTIDDYEAIGSG